VAEHATIDRKQAVSHLIAVRHLPGERRLHARFAGTLERGDARRRRQEIHRHVAAAAERRLELFEDEEHFAVVGAGVALRFDVHRADLAPVLPPREVCAGAQMGVVEAEAGWPRRERNPAAAARWNEGVPSSAEPSTSTATACPCRCSCSGVSVSL